MHRKVWLEKLVKDNNLKSGAEVGVYQGYTLMHLIDTCPELSMIGVDIWAEKPCRFNGTTTEELQSLPTNGPWYNDLLEFKAKHDNRVTLYRDFTINASTRVEDNSLDFIFIDADHTTQAVIDDLTVWIPKVKRGGFITGHDINMLTVSIAVNSFYTEYSKGPDNVWYLQKS